MAAFLFVGFILIRIPIQAALKRNN
jgi:hypothetical protein